MTDNLGNLGSLWQLDVPEVRTYPYLKLASVKIEIPRVTGNVEQEGFVDMWLARGWRDGVTGQLVEDQEIAGIFIKLIGNEYLEYALLPMTIMADIENVTLEFLYAKGYLPSGRLVDFEG